MNAIRTAIYPVVLLVASSAWSRFELEELTEDQLRPPTYASPKGCNVLSERLDCSTKPRLSSEQSEKPRRFSSEQSEQLRACDAEPPAFRHTCRLQLLDEFVPPPRSSLPES